MRDPKHPRQFTEEFRRQIVALVDSDTVNLLFTLCANESAPIALTYFHRFRQRFSTVFGYSVPLLSRGRSFSR